jgi:hypothetical protein
MSRDLTSFMRKLSPRIFQRSLNDKEKDQEGSTQSTPTHHNGNQTSPHHQQPLAALQVMSPTSGIGPVDPQRTNSTPTPTSSHYYGNGGTSSEKSSPASLPRAPSFSSYVPPPSASPVHTIQKIDSRYPDIIATLSNSLHYLNQRGFDHDRNHNHVSIYGFKGEDDHDHLDGKAFRVNIERDDFNDDVELDVDIVNVSSPSPATSDDEWSSDEDDDESSSQRSVDPANSSFSSKASQSSSLSGTATVLSPPNATHRSHRRNRSSTSSPIPNDISNTTNTTQQSSPAISTPTPTASISIGPNPSSSTGNGGSPPSSDGPNSSSRSAKHTRNRSNTGDFLSPKSGDGTSDIDARIRVETDGDVRTSISRFSETVTNESVTTTTTVTQTTVEHNPVSPVADPEWSLLEQAQLLEEILLFYVDLYWENQQAFSPFYKRKLDTWKDKAVMIYRHLFQDKKFKSTARYLKPHLIAFFERQLIAKTTGHPFLQHSNRPNDTTGFHPSHFKFASRVGSSSNTPPVDMISPASSEPSSPSSSGRSLPSGTHTEIFSPMSSVMSPVQTTVRFPTNVGSPLHINENLMSKTLPVMSGTLDLAPPPALARQQTTEADYFDQVNMVAMSLHKKYTAASQLINSKINEQILAPEAIQTTLKTPDQLNRCVISIMHQKEIELLLSQYHSAYQDAVVGFPGRVLMSKLLRHRIESVTFTPINFTDMIVAVNELTEILRKAFQKVASRNPKLIQNLIGSQRLESLREIHLEASAKRARDKAGYPESFSSWLYDSRLYPKFFTEESFLLLEKIHLKDARTFHYISEFKLQEAVWRLRDLKCEEDALVLEEAINTYIFSDAQVDPSAVANLGGGFTTTKLITFPAPDIKGVYKPKPVFDKGNFNLQTIKDSMVSNYKKEIAAYKIDKLLKLNHVPITKVAQVNGAKGSLQYFISEANSARDLNDVDYHHPLKSGKWTHSRGRTELPRTIRLFDFFINNRDRNLDNYLISDDGRIILIDHGWTFVAPSSKPSKQFLLKLIPKREVYENVKALHEDQARIDAELKPYLGPRNLAAFKRRLKTVVKFVEKQIKQRGVEAVFEQAEREDWKPVLD